MPVLKVNDQQYTLSPGKTRVGGPGSDVLVGAGGVQAIVDIGSDGKAVIRRDGDQSSARVNGVVLGVEPVPLLHGDKVDIDGTELTFSDDSKSGATQYVSAADIASLAAKRSGPARATAATGGRLVSLVDGKEYTIPDSGITIGREATCGVVVAQSEVSRLHAEILPAENGYFIHDRSTNGLYVNGTRVQGSQLLSRSDVIRAGSEDFRFYADVAAQAPAPRTSAATPPAAIPATPSTPATPPTPAPRVEAPAAAAPKPPALDEFTLLPDAHQEAPSAPADAGMKLADTSAWNTSNTPTAPPPKIPSEPAAPAAAAKPASPPPAPAKPVAPKPVLAVIEVIAEGPLKGTKIDITTPLAHVGRGAHNDIVFNDESVSDTHAKLQRRDDGWYVVDADSTNGTYVAGTRITGEKRLDGAPDLRFGGVKTIFRPRDAAPLDSTGTRAIAARKVDRPTAGTTIPLPASAQTSKPVEEKKSGGIPAWVWVVAVLVIAGVAALLVLKR